MAKKKTRAKPSVHKGKLKEISEDISEGTHDSSDGDITDDNKVADSKEVSDNAPKEIKQAAFYWAPGDIEDRNKKLEEHYGKDEAERIIKYIDERPAVKKVISPLVSWEGDDDETRYEKLKMCYGEEGAEEVLSYIEAHKTIPEEGVLIDSEAENAEKFDSIEYPMLPLDDLVTDTQLTSGIPKEYNIYDQRVQVAFPANQQIVNFGGSSDLTQFSACSNYVVRPVKRRVFIDRNGKELYEQEEIEAELSISGGQPTYFNLQPKDIRRLTDLISDCFPSAYLLENNKKAAKHIELIFRDALKSVFTERVFIDFGWQCIDGMQIYAHDGLNPSPLGLFQTGKTIPFYKDIIPEQVGQIVREALRLCKDAKTIQTLICFSLLGVMYKLFEAAGFPPHFLFFLHGPTGSMKTAISRVLFLQVMDTMNSGDYMRRFEDSLASLERGIALNGTDTITLVDDFCPPKDSKEQREKTEKIELLRRIAGDGVTKSRSNSRLDDVRGENVSGVIAVTGEITGNGMSSMLRCFFCPMMRNSVNLEILTEFQDDPMLYTTVIVYLSQFLGNNWERLINYIKESISSERKIWRRYLNEPRVVDAASQFGIAANILGGFLKAFCRQDALEVDSLIAEMRNSLMQNAMISEASSVEESLADRIVRAINLLLLGNDFIILDVRPTPSTFSDMDGFRENGYLYMRPEKLYTKVAQVFASRGMKLSINAYEMARLLVSEGIAESTPNGKGKRINFARIPVGDDKHVQFIKIFENGLTDYPNS